MARAAALWTSATVAAAPAADGGLRSTYSSTTRLSPVAIKTLRAVAEQTGNGHGRGRRRRRLRLVIRPATYRVQTEGRRGGRRGQILNTVDDGDDDGNGNECIGTTIGGDDDDSNANDNGDQCNSTTIGGVHKQRQQHSLGRLLLNTAAAAAVSLSLSLSGGVDLAAARPVGVNRPELLPESFTPVIDIAGFLTPQQEGRIAQDVSALEEETGFKLRVLAQNYPETPGLAVKNFWQVDDNTIVFVADPSMGNILNFNVGASVDLNVPRSFWSRLAGKYGNIFFWREKGEDASIEAAVAAIGECLREPAGPRACAEIK